MRRISSFFIRISTFFSKELAEVIRQPKLILTLILGPFLILLLFGLGYNNTQNPTRTLFVAGLENAFAKNIQSNMDALEPAIIFFGLTDDEAFMRQQLASGVIDMGVIIPDNAYEQIKSNQHAEFKFVHNEIDPVQASYVNYLGNFFTEVINQQVLQGLAERGQVEAGNMELQVDAALLNTRTTREALERGDVVSARVSQQVARRSLSSLQLIVGSSASLLSGVNQSMGGEPGQEQDILTNLQALISSPSMSEEITEGKANYDQEITNLREEESNLELLKVQLSTFNAISPEIMTMPFISATETITKTNVSAMNFFVPGVIVLLLQHLSITLSSLSIVRETRSGTMELFRVSPLKAGEILFSKYFSYMFIGLLIAVVLITLIYYGLKVPMLGSLVDIVIVVSALLFASLGIGFVISLIASTETQAVQFSMIVLLLSVFFSGFFLDLRFLMVPVRYISYAIPATFGTNLLQNIMLRGAPLSNNYLVNLLGMGLGLFILAWVMLSRKMKHE